MCFTCLQRMIDVRTDESDPPTPRELIVMLPCPTCRQEHEIEDGRFAINYVIRGKYLVTCKS